MGLQKEGNKKMTRSRSRSPRERRPRKRSPSPLSRQSTSIRDHRSSKKLAFNNYDNCSFNGNTFLQDKRNYRQESPERLSERWRSEREMIAERGVVEVWGLSPKRPDTDSEDEHPIDKHKNHQTMGRKEG